MSLRCGALGAGFLVLCAAGVALLCCGKSGDRRGSVPSGPDWTTYNSRNSGLADDWVLAIAADASGAVWFGTRKGVSMFHE